MPWPPETRQTNWPSSLAAANAGLKIALSWAGATDNAAVASYLVERQGGGSPGFVGAQHIDAVRRLGFVDIVAVAAVSDEEARSFGNAIGVNRAPSREHLPDPNSQHVPHSGHSSKAPVWC